MNSIGRFFRGMFNFCFGWIGSKADKMQTNKHVMAATYDRSIEKGRTRYEQVENAVASLIAIREKAVTYVKNNTESVTITRSRMTGAKAAMQKRINELTKAGQTKEQIEEDAAFIKHRGAYIDMKSTLKEKEDAIAAKEGEIAARNEQLATYKLELQQMQRNQAKLKEEKHEALADVAIAQETASINKTLAGIASDTTDQDLQAAREAREQAKAKAQISTEMAGNDTRLAEAQYDEYATEIAADSELDAELDWGDSEGTSELDDAKLSE